MRISICKCFLAIRFQKKGVGKENHLTNVTNSNPFSASVVSLFPDCFSAFAFLLRKLPLKRHIKTHFFEPFSSFPTRFICLCLRLRPFGCGNIDPSMKYTLAAVQISASEPRNPCKYRKSRGSLAHLGFSSSFACNYFWNRQLK